MAESCLGQRDKSPQEVAGQFLILMETLLPVSHESFNPIFGIYT